MRFQAPLLFGDGRRKLLAYCKRHGQKMRLESSKDLTWRVVLGGRGFREATGASAAEAQDAACEVALGVLERRGAPRQELMAYCVARGAKECQISTRRGADG